MPGAVTTVSFPMEQRTAASPEPGSHLSLCHKDERFFAITHPRVALASPPADLVFLGNLHRAMPPHDARARRIWLSPRFPLQYLHKQLQWKKGLCTIPFCSVKGHVCSASQSIPPSVPAAVPFLPSIPPNSSS